MVCRICGHQNISEEILLNNDKMFQLKEIFEYFVCENCDTLQIVEIPENISNHYPENYYSFTYKVSLKDQIIDYIRNWVLYLNFPKFLVEKINNRIPNFPLNSFLKLNLKKDTKILDIGCGVGHFLRMLHHLHFKNIMGIDPYISKEQRKPFPILKKELNSITEKFDLITFHHVFEHLENVNEALEKCNSLLNNNGKIIIRVPVKDSFAFEHYKENWVQWDAPRHFQLLTKKAFHILADKHHFKITDYYCDSDESQFIGSEKYKKGLSGNAPNNIFTQKELQKFKNESLILNKNGNGDSIVAVLEKLN